MSGDSVQRIVTSGIFSLDGEDFDVDNNVWIVGNESEVVVIDAAHSAEPIVEAIGGRTVRAVVLTHGHNDHINAAGAVADAVGAPIWIHPADSMLWETVYPDRSPDGNLADGQIIEIATLTLEVMNTPGHSPGSCCLYSPGLGEVFTGDTLFNGGPGATGRSFSDHPTIVQSINERLMTLPGETVVHTGHGPDTTVAAERENIR